MRRWLPVALIACWVVLPGTAATQDQRGALDAWLAAQASRIPARMGVYVKHLGTGVEAQVGADAAFNSMSVIKVPVMVRAFQLAEQGSLSLDKRIEITRERLRDGSGVLQYHDMGLAPTLRDLITQMIITSDNTATDIVVLEVGGVAAVNDWLASAGYTETRMIGRGFEYRRRLLALLDPALADITAEETTGLMYASQDNPNFALYASIFDGPRRRWVDLVRSTEARQRLARERRERVANDPAFWLGRMTAREIGRMLEGIERDALTSAASSAQMKQILRRQQLGVRRIPHFLDVPVGHKTGDFGPIIANDVGVVYARSGPIVIAMLNSGNTGPYAEFEDSLGLLARGIVDFFDGAATAR
jgi:hypothetical protein